MYRLRQTFVVIGSVVTGGQNIGTHRQADEEIDQQID